MPDIGGSYSLFPQQSYVLPSSSSQVSSYQNLLGQTCSFSDVDIVAGITKENSARDRSCILVQNNPNGSNILPGSTLQYTANYNGQYVDACATNGTWVLCAPGYINGSQSAVIPPGAFFWAVKSGPTTVVSDGTAISENAAITQSAETAGEAKAGSGNGVALAAAASGGGSVPFRANLNLSG